MSQPVYLSSPTSYPMSSFPSGQSTISPGAGSPRGLLPPLARGYGVSGSTSPSSEWAPQPPAPRPIFRAKGPDEPAGAPMNSAAQTPLTRPLMMPTPEQLGVARAPNSPISDMDWTAIHRQFEKLGAVCFRMDRMENGG